MGTAVVTLALVLVGLAFLLALIGLALNDENKARSKAVLWLFAIAGAISLVLGLVLLLLFELNIIGD